MRISESKSFLWHRLCLLPQGTTRQMGLSLLLQRGHVEGGGAPWGRASQPWATAPTSTTATRAARSSPPSLQKHGDSSRLGTGEEFPPSRESRTQECLLVRVAKGKEKCFCDWVQLYQLFAGAGLAWRPGCSVQACVPAKLAINYRFCHADPMLLWLHLLIPLTCACSEPCLCFQICSHCTHMTVRSM